jgi:hypothetical protein
MTLNKGLQKAAQLLHAFKAQFELQNRMRNNGSVSAGVSIATANSGCFVFTVTQKVTSSQGLRNNSTTIHFKNPKLISVKHAVYVEYKSEF